VEYELDAPTWLGPWSKGSATAEDASRVHHLLKSAGLLSEVFENLLPVQWSKLIFNATVNAISAVTDLPFSTAYLERHSKADLGYLVNNLINEGKAVASALNIELYQDPMKMMDYAATQLESISGNGRIPSMLADINCHRQTEVDWINGAIVEAASRKAVSTPYNETLYQLIKAREKSWLTAGLAI
jgi:2-dehydropantoate 2-reductase